MIELLMSEPMGEPTEPARLFFDVPFSEFTVVEGLLLLILISIFLFALGKIVGRYYFD